MPIFINPNPHSISISISIPSTNLRVYPHAWLKSRIPHDGQQEVELDSRLAKEFVRTGMLAPKPMNGEPPVQVATPARDLDGAKVHFTTSLPIGSDEDSPMVPKRAEPVMTSESMAPKPSPLVEAAEKAKAADIPAEPAVAAKPLPKPKIKKARAQALPAPAPAQTAPRKRFVVPEE